MPKEIQELRGHSSRVILFLKKITPAVEKYCYWALSKANKKESIKKDVALALVAKIIPSKFEGEFKHDFAERFYELAEAQLEGDEVGIFENLKSQPRFAGD